MRIKGEAVTTVEVEKVKRGSVTLRLESGKTIKLRQGGAVRVVIDFDYYSGREGKS